MKAESFERISRRAEAMAERWPGLYQGLLAAMAVAGYAYILLILAVLLALIGLIIGVMIYSHRIHGAEIKLLIVMVLLVWVLLRVLWVRVMPPTGVPVKRDEAPDLYATIDEIRRKVGAPPVKKVLLVPELNASVVQVPMFGLLGWHRNYLCIGLPLLCAMTPNQFRAVLAHEFGHLSGSHGKMGVWIYRVHQTWGMLANAFGREKSFMRFVFMPMLKGYIPRFSAFSLAQIRQHEYAADQCGSEAAGNDAMVSALVRLHVLGEQSQRLWESVLDRVRRDPAPPAPMSQVQSGLVGFNDMERGEAWLRRALLEPTEGCQSHPALADRIGALVGHRVEAGSHAGLLLKHAFETQSGLSAAHTYLRARLGEFSDALDAYWREQIAQGWKMRHAEIQEAKSRLNELTARALKSDLKGADAWSRAELTELVEGLESALPLYRQFLEENPEDVRALFSVGRALLETHQSEGIPFMEAAMAKSPNLKVAASHLLAQYHHDAGDMETARRWRFAREDSSEELETMEQERQTLTTSDKFLPHDLDPALVEMLRSKLAETGEKVKAYLVRKQTRRYSEVPCYVLVIHRVVPWWKYEDSGANEARDRKILEAVTKDLSLPCDIRIFLLGRSTLLSRIAKVKGGAV